MQPLDKIGSHIIISEEFDLEVEELKKNLIGFRVVTFVEENFKIEHAKAVMSEAYVSEIDTKYIVIASIEFTSVAQNSLLKLLEEPPKNIEFIIISPSKSNLLQTVRSRLPILKIKNRHNDIKVDIRLSKLDYKEVFEFLKKHNRVSKNEAKVLVEALFFKATVDESMILSQEQLENFDLAYRLIDLNSKVQSVLAMILMSFVKER